MIQTNPPAAGTQHVRPVISSSLEARLRGSVAPAALSPTAHDRFHQIAARATVVQEIELDLDLPFAVKHWLLAGETSMFFAPSNLGKSTLVVDLARGIVSGEDWHGFPTQRGAVIYFAAESAISIIERAKPVLAADSAPFVVVDDRIDLFNSILEVQALAALAGQVGDEAAEPVRLIVIDTLTLSMGDGDENSNADAVRITRSATQLAARTGAHVLLVHHTGKDRSSGARGASGLIDGIDAAVELVSADRDGQPVVRAIQVKQRRIPKDKSITFRVASLLLGHDSSGEPRTTSTIEIVSSGQLFDWAQDPAPARTTAVLAGLDDLRLAGTVAGTAAGFTAAEIAAASLALSGTSMKADSWKKAVRGVLRALEAEGRVVQHEAGRFELPVVNLDQPGSPAGRTDAP